MKAPRGTGATTLAPVLRAALDLPSAMRYVESGRAVLIAALPDRAAVALRSGQGGDLTTLEADGRALAERDAAEWERDDRYDVTVFRATAGKTAATVVVPRVAG